MTLKFSVPPGLVHAGDSTQGFLHAGQALDQLSHVLSLCLVLNQGLTAQTDLRILELRILLKQASECWSRCLVLKFHFSMYSHAFGDALSLSVVSMLGLQRCATMSDIMWWPRVELKSSGLSGSHFT